MKKIELNGIEYEIVENIDQCLEEDVLKEKVTDYFEPYDYIFGDYAYEKMRLKGFYEEKNKKATEINNIKNLDTYKKEYCSYGSKTFLLKKIQEKHL